MKTLADLYNIPNLSKIVAEQNKLPSSIAKMIQDSGVLKQLRIYERYNLGNLITPSVLNAVKESNRNLEIFSSGSHSFFSESTLDSIASFASKQHSLLQSLNGVDWSKYHSSISQQLPNFNFALIGISSEIAKIAVQNEKWDLLDDFDKISDKAIEINQNAIENEGITKENFKELKQLVDKIELKIDHQQNRKSEIILKYITIICFILALMGEARNWTPQPNYATNEEVTEIIKTQIQNLEIKLKEQGENRFTRVKCKVMLRPRNKSLLINQLPENYDIIVLNTFHKWAYVSYLNPKDGLPESGWVMKKYILKRKSRSFKE